jgi:hypothetical protein
MYRGSRLAASFLLFLTGSAVLALGLGVMPRAIGPGGAWILVPIVVAFGVAHFLALAGIALGRGWGRELAVSIAEIGGGIAIASLVPLVLGADPFTATTRGDGLGFVAWMIGMYALLGVSAGRTRLGDGPRPSRRPTSQLLRASAAGAA